MNSHAVHVTLFLSIQLYDLHGTFLLWFGPVAKITITDPDMVREIFSVRFDDYEKTESSSVVRKLEGDGLLNLKGDKWVQHRSIINPAFHMENLRVIIISNELLLFLLC